MLACYALKAKQRNPTEKYYQITNTSFAYECTIVANVVTKDKGSFAFGCSSKELIAHRTDHYATLKVKMNLEIM